MAQRKFNANNVQFDYFSENYIRFEEDFYQYSRHDVPLTFITDDLLHAMSEGQINYFTLPAYKAIDNQPHYFIFKVTNHGSNPQMRIYEYLRHSLFHPKQLASQPERPS